MNTWRAGCSGSCTSGSEGGPEKPTDRKTDRALRSDPYTETYELFPGFFVPFNATMYGTSVTVVDNASGSGTWVGRWQGKLVNGVGFYQAVAHGTDDFAGMKMKLVFTGDQPFPIEGRILDPHGD